MSCLDALVRIDSSSDKLPAPRKRFDFDLNGHPISALGFFKRAHRALLVDSGVKVQCTSDLRIPDRDSDSIRVQIAYQARCPFAGEEALAKALFHAEDDPKKVLDRIISECASEYVRSIGEQRFFDEFYTHHHAGLSDALPGRVAGRAGITLEELGVHVITAVSPNVPIRFNSEPFDLADNCLGVPVNVQTDFEVDTTNPAARGRALQRAERLAAFEQSSRESIKTFFRKIPLHRLHRNPDEVSRELRAELKPSAEREGRIASRLVVGIDSSADQVVPFDSKFDCRLADGTDLSSDASGALWITDVARTVARTDWKKREEIQSKLTVMLQAHAREIIAKYSYTEFREKAASIWEEIAKALQAEGTRSGVRVSLNWRTAWPFDWLVTGEFINRTVECEVGQERIQCKLLVALSVQLVDSSRLRSHPTRRDEFLAAVQEIVDHTIAYVLQGSELSEYYNLETHIRERIGQRISDALFNKFGLRVADLRFQRKDNLAAQNMVDFVQHAPVLTVEHPTLPNIVYEVHYRVLAYASSVGFPIYPKDISSLSASVEAATRQFLSDLPPQMFRQSKRGDLQRIAKQTLSQMMETQHRLRIEILNWIPVRRAGSPLYDQLLALVDQLVFATDPMDQHDMRIKAIQLARLLTARGEPVPVDELAAVGVDCSPLALSPAEERKALPANADR